MMRQWGRIENNANAVGHTSVSIAVLIIFFFFMQEDKRLGKDVAISQTTRENNLNP